MAFVSKVAPFESGHPTLTSCHTERSQSSSLVSRRPLVEDCINPSNQKNKFSKNSARQAQFSAYIPHAALQTFYVSKPCIFSIHIGTGLRACPTAKTLLQQFSILPHASIFFFLAANQGKLFRRKPCFTSQPPLLFRGKQRPRHSLFRESFSRLFFASWLSAFSFMFRARSVRRHRFWLSLALHRLLSSQTSPRS